MSTYQRSTKNPMTGEFEDALWLDDYFGRHRYGVQFADGTVYRQSDHVWEFDDKPVQSQPMQFPVRASTSGDSHTAGQTVSGHPQLSFIRRALRDLESLRDAAVCNGKKEQRLAAYLRAACKCVELALMEAESRE